MPGPTVDWFLTASERGNPTSLIDRGHRDGEAFSRGNEVRALVHGAQYFARLLECVRAAGPGDLLMFTDWRGDPDEHLDGLGTEVGGLLEDAARRGVDVRGLVWRSHLDRFRFSAAENRHLGQEINAAGGECLMDMRVRPMGSHHQKLVVLRHSARPDDDVAFVGGIDLCHSRRDDTDHAGDPQAQPMAAAYGRRPPWHDVQMEVRGPAVADLETVFRERWDDPAPLSRDPVRWLADSLRGNRASRSALPPPLPAPAGHGTHRVQVLRTYPVRHPGYPFAPAGERSVARGYAKALARARELVYLEDQYLWSAGVVRPFAEALRANADLHMVVVLPRVPDQDGRALAPNLVGRAPALAALRAAGGDRFAVYGLENPAGTPVYVHAKVCVIDDTWAAVGSDNVNRRSWTHDSEVACSVVDEHGAGRSGFARDLRLKLAAEHLDLTVDELAACPAADGAGIAAAFAASAAGLEAWHRSGRHGPRPRGRLRPYSQEPLSATTRAWSTVLYRVLFDPDGRSPRARARDRY